MLTADGFAVKLNHDDAETSWEKHGYVELSLGDAKVRSELYQHNRNFHKRGDEAYALLKELKAKCPDSMNKYAECMDYRSNKFDKCRAEQAEFEKECPL